MRREVASASVCLLCRAFTADRSGRACDKEVTFVAQDDEPVGLDGLRVEFDDERVVSDAGVMLVATLAERVGIEALAADLMRLRRDRPGAAQRGAQGDGAAVRDGLGR
jgi:hypothetical protein